MRDSIVAVVISHETLIVIRSASLFFFQTWACSVIIKLSNRDLRERKRKMKLVAVRPRDRELLWNINQKYLYEMTNFYDDEMDARGNLHYGHFDAYFTDPKRKAFFLYDEKDVLMGFAMIHPYSNLDGTPDYVLAEFTVFPMYRRKHLAITAAEMLFARFRGCWEIKYNEKNVAAKTLWNKVTEPYSPRMIRFSDTETVLAFCSSRQLAADKAHPTPGTPREATPE